MTHVADEIAGQPDCRRLAQRLAAEPAKRRGLDPDQPSDLFRSAILAPS